MVREPLPLDAARQVTPRALVGYAQGLGWQRVANGKRPEIAVFHRPGSPLHQVVIPTDPTFADFDEAVAEAVRKLADSEKRPAREVLEHLLLPPADVLRFREASPDAEAGSLSLGHAARMIDGARRLLLSAAHGVLGPRAYPPRLSRSEAEEFVGRCRMGQTDRGSFIVNIACLLDLPVALPGTPLQSFARRVTSGLMQSLEALSRSAETGKADDLLDLERTPGMSANLCESVLLMRPDGERASLVVSAAWSRAFLPRPREMAREIQLGQEAFSVAESVATRLRAAPKPVPALWFGFVDALRGQPSRDDIRPSGEVDFTIFDSELGAIHTRGLLNATDYAVAAEAHLESAVVEFRATLQRLPRISRLDGIADFSIAEEEEADVASAPVAS